MVGVGNVTSLSYMLLCASSNTGDVSLAIQTTSTLGWLLGDPFVYFVCDCPAEHVAVDGFVPGYCWQ